MFKTIAIAILTLALGGAGYFAFTQKSAYGNASKEVAALEEKIKEAEKKEEEAAEELKSAEEALQAIPPLEAKLKDHLTDLQWDVLYKRTVGDMSNNEISEEKKSPHYNISRAYKAAIINAKEYLEIEMRNENQDENWSGVIDQEEVSIYESKLDTSNTQQFVVAS